jgi:hypothetical protein
MICMTFHEFRNLPMEQWIEIWEMPLPKVAINAVYARHDRGRLRNLAIPKSPSYSISILCGPRLKELFLLHWQINTLKIVSFRNRLTSTFLREAEVGSEMLSDALGCSLEEPGLHNL